MNKIKKLLMAFVAVFMVSSCDTPNSSSTNDNTSSNEVVDNTSTPSVEESSSEDTSTPEDTSSDVQVDEYNVLPDWPEESFDISTGGDFLDVAVGRSFMTGAEYTLSYSLGNDLPSTGEIIQSSNEKVFTVETVGNTIKLKALHAGQAKIRIIDSNEVTRYCTTIKIEDPIPLDYMEEYLVYDCEYWVSVFAGTGSNYTLTFNEGGVFTINATIDGTTYVPITGTYKYSETVNNGKEHVYLFDESQDLNATGLVGFHVAATGTFMYLQYYGGTDAIMFPSHLVNNN